MADFSLLRVMRSPVEPELTVYEAEGNPFGAGDDHVASQVETVDDHIAIQVNLKKNTAIPYQNHGVNLKTWKTYGTSESQTVSAYH